MCRGGQTGVMPGSPSAVRENHAPPRCRRRVNPRSPIWAAPITELDAQLGVHPRARADAYQHDTPDGYTGTLSFWLRSQNYGKMGWAAPVPDGSQDMRFGKIVQMVRKERG